MDSDLTMRHIIGYQIAKKFNQNVYWLLMAMAVGTDDAGIAKQDS